MKKGRFYYPPRSRRTIDFETIVNNPHIDFEEEFINNWTSEDCNDFNDYLKKTNDDKEYFSDWAILKQQYKELIWENEYYLNRIKIGNQVNAIYTIFVINFTIIFSIWFLVLLMFSAYLIYYYNLVRKNRALRTYNFVKRNLDSFVPFGNNPRELKF